MVAANQSKRHQGRFGRFPVDGNFGVGRVFVVGGSAGTQGQVSWWSMGRLHDRVTTLACTSLVQSERPGNFVNG
jgi:hypothetical protein